jgi:predicted transglutaminase-like cysteine proteinase
MQMTAISNQRLLPALLPKVPAKVQNILDTLSPRESSLLDVTPFLYKPSDIKWAVIQLGQEADSGLGYQKYLQYHSSRLQSVAESIVSRGDTNDEKVFKIEQWVKDNIRYVSEARNDGTPELWSFPTVTLERTTGDCEDGAFLIHSLALHAGVPVDRLRTYGGIVFADEYGLTVSGRAWTAYMREMDDQWIIVDWCSWAKDAPLSDRIPMSDDHKYFDDYFFVEAGRTVETPTTNRVRYARLAKGVLVNTVF